MFAWADDSILCRSALRTRQDRSVAGYVRMNLVRAALFQPHISVEIAALVGSDQSVMLIRWACVSELHVSHVLGMLLLSSLYFAGAAKAWL